MPSRKLPGLALNGFWNIGESWKAGGDENWLKLSVMVQLAVESATTALPVSPVNGVVYIVPHTDAVNGGKVAVRDDGVWVYLIAPEGALAWVKDTSKRMELVANTWSDVPSGSGSEIPDAPNDGSPYLRSSSAWTKFIPGTNVSFDTAVSGEIKISATGGGSGELVNFTEAAWSSAPNSTVPVVSLKPVSTEREVDIALVPKGIGSFILAVPDNSTAGGGKRGQRSVDLQLKRAYSAQVASGQSSVIGGGANNSSSGDYSVAAGGMSNKVGGHRSTVSGGKDNTIESSDCTIAGGTTNTISASGAGSTISGGTNNFTDGNCSFSSIAGGTGNEASGQYSTVLGGVQNKASGLGSVASGNNSWTRNLRYSKAHSAGMFAEKGDCQTLDFILRGATTGATIMRLTATGGIAPDTTNQYIPNTNSSATIEGVVTARSSTGITASWRIVAVVKRISSGSSFVGTPSVTPIATDVDASSWAVDVSIDTYLKAVAVSFTGAAATSIRVVAYLRAAELGH